MLVISRKAGQGLTLGNSIHVRVLEISGGSVKLGVDAPADVSVYRDELYADVADMNRRAAAHPVDPPSDD